MNFSEWLAINEMAMVSRQKLAIDENDIAYLKQFPLPAWAGALKLRYGELIFRATDHGELRPDWDDVQDVTISFKDGITRTQTFRVNTGMTNVIKKLKDNNYDLTGTNPLNRTSLFIKPMEAPVASSIIRKIISSITPEKISEYKSKYRNALATNTIKQLNQILDPQPNIIFFSPNHNSQSRNDPEPTQPETAGLRSLFDKMKEQIYALINKKIDNLKKIRTPNAFYWLQKRDELFNMLYEKVWLNWKDERLHNPRFLSVFIQNAIRTTLQSGVVSRRNYDAMKNAGFDAYKLYSANNKQTNSPWTHDEIRQVIDAHKTPKERINAFKKGWNGTPVANNVMQFPKSTNSMNKAIS